MILINALMAWLDHCLARGRQRGFNRSRFALHQVDLPHRTGRIPRAKKAPQPEALRRLNATMGLQGRLLTNPMKT